MHEASIVQALLERVEAEASAREACSIGRVVVRLGEASGVDPELLIRAWELCKLASQARDAELALEPVLARWECGVCARAIAAGAVLRCPECGRPARLVAGDEIVLQRIEMEVP